MTSTRAAPRARPLALALALALAALLLAGCGQKGPLYLPGDEAAEERYGSGAAHQGERHDADDEDTD